MIEKQRRRNRPTLTEPHAADAGPGPSLDLLSWTALHRVWLREGQLFDLANHLYLADIYNCREREIVIAKASQMGASEYAVSYALHACDQRRATVLYVFPTETHVGDFSAERINPALEVSSYLSQLVVGGRGAGTGKRGSDRVTLKRVRDRFLYLRGAQVSPSGNAPQLKSVAADVVVFDELDEMDPRAPAIGVKRLGHSPIGGRLDISTLTYHGRGIHARFLESDQRIWHVPCAACGEWQPLEIEQVVIEWDELKRPVAWHGMKEGRAFVACRKCGRELDRLGRGRWVTTYPEREIAGFHLSKLFSAPTDLMDIIRQLGKTDETVRRECYNQDLGLPYTPRGGQVTEAALDACRRDYSHGPVRGERPVMGVDVGNMLHVVVRGPLDANGERPQRFAGELATFDELGRLIRQYRPRRVVIDGMPETRMARQLQADFPKGQIWLAYYAERSKDEEAVHFDREKGTVAVDRTRTLDALMEGFSEVMQENTLPANAREIGGGDYYRHLMEPVRVIDESRRAGMAIARYVAQGADHYCFAAGTLIETKSGQMPIEQIRPGMRVMTRRGYRRVTAAGMTARSAGVRRYRFSNGAELVATPSHPIFVQGRGFVPLGAVRYGDEVEICQNKNNLEWNPSSIRALSSGAIPAAHAGRIASITHRAGRIACGVLSGCTRRFGKTSTALSRRNITSTMWITIRSIMIRPTWNASLAASTGLIIANRQSANCPQRSSPQTWIGFGRSRKRGTGHPRENDIIKSWLSICGRRIKKSLPAFIAARSLNRFRQRGTRKIAIVPTPAIQRIGERWGWITRLASAWSAAPLLKQTDLARAERVRDDARASSAVFIGSEPVDDCPVFNLTVKEAHEYYANGILVHNCHAENYCLVAAQGANLTSLGVAVGRGAKGW